MAKIPLTAELKNQYEELFNSCQVRAEKLVAVEQIIGRLLINHDRYQSVADRGCKKDCVNGPKGVNQQP